MIVVQVNGKLRARTPVPQGADQQTVERRVLAEPALQKWLQDMEIVRVVYVPDRLLNLVVE